MQSLENEKDERDERGKGSAPPQWMPAIMGWVSMERIKERSRELYRLFKDN